ncbi:OLC1v1009275C1 [Oldenlandia corymbosa var. corymbosa]|uniref:OLC1v1009275C1 n=1 Tax=Oldenlandia corymbosa var. corymbosa TaxID=529605 RepID=A0AAV1DRU6_OLDCO|nr:OLC1v1009275C1 [Oldenlandia corymbosa var. corymbosa]
MDISGQCISSNISDEERRIRLKKQCMNAYSHIPIEIDLCQPINVDDDDDDELVELSLSRSTAADKLRLNYDQIQSMKKALSSPFYRVILAADHPSGFVDSSVIQVTGHILATVSGDDAVQGLNLLVDLYNNECYGGILVEDAAKLLSEALRTYQGRALVCIVWMARGDLRRGMNFATGSGYQIANRYVIVSYRLDMSVERAAGVGKLAICRAGYRTSGETGGFASVYFIGAAGWKTAFYNLNIEDTVQTQFPFPFTV